MKLWNKKVAGATILSMSMLLAACNGSEKETTDTKDGDTSDKKVEIVYASGVDVTGATDKLIAAFEEKNPNITVKRQEMPADTGASHDQYIKIVFES